MKTKTKISLTVLPPLIVGIIAINITFGLFFQAFIIQSERDKIYASSDTISSYLNEKVGKYLGTVNDWAHWNDTYNFVETQNGEFVELNLTDSAMAAIDINFIIFLNRDGLIIYQLFYNSDEGKVTEFPIDLLKNNSYPINFSKIAEDTSGIIQIGNSFYFVASSQITDSLEKENANGTLIIGRQIDSTIIEQMEKTAGVYNTKINGLNDINQLEESFTKNVLEIRYDKNPSNSISIKLAVPNDYDLESSILVSAVMPRDLYMTGMDKITKFILINTSIGLILSLTIFLLINNFISKPFSRLMNDIKAIDIAKNKLFNIPESGKDEFSILRKSINMLIDNISISQNELIKSREEMYATLMSIGEGILSIDKYGKIKFMNLAAQKMTGCKLEEFQNKQLDTVLILIDEDSREPVGNLAEVVFETGEMHELTNHVLVVANEGIELSVVITVAPIKDFDGTMIGSVLAVKDITENKKTQRRIEYLSYRDALTGLYNRRFYEDKLKEYDIKENPLVSLIVVDVNGLKLTNDAFGHTSGDSLLIKVAECLENSIRTEDIVCRIGGDEFVILLPFADHKATEGVINRLYVKIENEKNKIMPISISSGWATKQKKDEKLESVFKRAEDMMYHNKSAERKSLRHESIQIIMKTLIEKNPREEFHSKGVGELCVLIGEEMEMDPTKIMNIKTAGLYHDIGKISISNGILDKEGPLNDDEWLEIKKHPVTSFNILCAINDYGTQAEIALSHHERWDGSGYPNGLRGEEILLEARIVAIADAFDAMVSERPYRKKMEVEKALEILKNESGKQFDPAIVSLFVEKVIKKLKADSDSIVVVEL